MFDLNMFSEKKHASPTYDKEMTILYAKFIICNKTLLLLLMLNLNLTLSNTTVSWYK